MPVVSNRLELIYYDIPKVACTSLKALFWEIENGRPLPVRGKLSIAQRIQKKLGLLEVTDIHYQHGYRTCSHARARTLDLPEGFERITVLRDPIARLYSAWTNKAGEDVFERRDEMEDLLNEELSVSPGFGEYIDRFEAYRSVSRPVRVHTLPYSWHLGPDLSAYDHVFKIEDMDALRAFLSGKAGYEISLPHSNSTPAAPPGAGLHQKQIDRLLDLTRVEYDWLNGFYDQTAGLDRLLAKIGARRA